MVKSLLWLLNIVPLFVHIQTGDTTWTRIEVFISAPDGKIHIPIVQRHWHVSDGMGEIPAADAPLVNPSKHMN